MTRRGRIFLATGLIFLAALASSAGDSLTNPGPDFKEVYDLLRANLPGTTDESLNRAAVEGLLAQFHGKVLLAGGAQDGSGTLSGGTALSKSTVLENNVAYWCVSRVTGNLAGELGAAYRVLTTTNKVVGAVLDLRFASGDDYAAARETAKWLAAQKPAHPVAGPLVVLVNGETRGAAETLTKMLHEADAALIIGSPTAGATITFKEYVLKNGEQLSIAVPPGKPAGAEDLRVQPDIALLVNVDDERAFLENPYGPLVQDKTAPKVATNSFLPFVDHTSEADLVRHRKKDDADDEDSTAPAAAGPAKPVIRDPALARALDLVKGLAVVRESHL